MAVGNLNAELELPSVIIDMPELQKMAARKKAFQGAMWSLAILIFSALSALIYIEITGSTRETVSADELEVKSEAQGSLKLTVQLVPENVQGAVVQVDGKVISGNPPYVYLEPTDDYHSIKIRAPGYRHMNKDVQVNSSEVVSFTLIPESARQVAAITVEELMAEELDTEGFDENSDDLIEEIRPIAKEVNAGKKQKETGRKLKNAAGVEQKPVKEPGKGKQLAAAMGGPAKGTPGKSPQKPEKPTAAVAVQAATSGAESKTPAVKSATEEKSGKSSVIPSVQLYKPPKASLIINAPLGVTNRVAVSVDGQMRGYLPVLLKVDAGLHELTFVYEGHRTFQMVKLNAGQIVRIVPKL